MITIENLCKAYNDKILFKNFHLEIPDSRFLVRKSLLTPYLIA